MGRSTESSLHRCLTCGRPAANAVDGLSHGLHQGWGLSINRSTPDEEALMTRVMVGFAFFVLANLGCTWEFQGTEPSGKDAEGAETTLVIERILGNDPSN